MKTFIRSTILVIISLAVFIFVWVLLGRLAEYVVSEYMNNAINMPTAFAWGAINAFLAHRVAQIFDTGLDNFIWGEAK